MSGQINQPSNQIKLTNISLVRLKKGKKRFEIACYKNKVLEWRQGIETDLDNVLQIPNVFLNVSKGQTAPNEDLHKAFGKTTTRDDIILEILNKGELQVGDKERAAALERVHNEVVGIVASKLVDPRSKRVYTTGMIEKALDMLSLNAHNNNSNTTAEKKDTSTAAKASSASGTSTPTTAETPDVTPAAKPQPQHVWTGVVTTKSAKSQALEAIKALVANQPIPVARARMRLRITCPTGLLKQGVKAAPSAGGAGGKDTNNSNNNHKAGKGGKKGKKAAAEEVEERVAAPVTAAADEEGEDGEKKAAGTVKEKILGYIEQVESQDVVGSEWEVVGFVEPGAYKGLSDFIANDTKGQGHVEVLDTAITSEDD